MKLNIGVLGGGSWGTTVASLAARNNPVKIWARDPSSVKDINENHTNKKYLAEAVLSPSLQARHTIEEVVKYADVIVMAVPSQSFREVLVQAKDHIRPWVPIVSLTKGLERNTNMRMTQIIETILPGHPTGVLTGPNLAREIINGQAAASVISMVDENITTNSSQH